MLVPVVISLAGFIDVVVVFDVVVVVVVFVVVIVVANVISVLWVFRFKRRFPIGKGKRHQKS